VALRFAWPSFAESRVFWMRAAFVATAAVFLVALARAVEARITWYLAVDQFGYLQFANDLLQGKVFHDWAPARILAIPSPTDVLAQTYIWDDGRMYCRYSPGFPMLVAGWLALFGDARIALLNPTIYLGLLGMVIACEWRLAGSAWRGLVVAVLVALCPTMMYWWSLTLTRDLSAHFFALIGLYQLIPRAQALTLRRALVAGLAIGFAASIRNDAVLYLLPATLLAGYCWLRERPGAARLARLAGGALAGLVLGLLPTLSYNALTTGNPFHPTQGMEIEKFFPTTPAATENDGARVGYPSVWKGSTVEQVSGGGLRLEHFPRTAPREWLYVFTGYGWVLLGLAALGALVALVRRPAIFLFVVPYAVSAFLFYSCWSRPDRRYIIGLYTMMPFLVTEGVLGSVALVRTIARRRGNGAARPVAAGLVVLGVVAALAPIPLPEPISDYLSQGVLSVLSVLLPLAMAFGAAAALIDTSRPVAPVLAAVLALVLAGYGVVRAEATRPHRAPFQRPEATLARETLRRTLAPRAVVITSEDMGRPAENIEYYAGVPALYLTDLDRWKLKASAATLRLIAAGRRPYLLIDRQVPERAHVLAELDKQGFVTERVLEIPSRRKMEYFVASPVPRNIPSELYRISHPFFEASMKQSGMDAPE
jgi:hypothetical protein